MSSGTLDLMDHHENFAEMMAERGLQPVLPMLGDYWGWYCVRCRQGGPAADHDDSLALLAAHDCKKPEIG